MAVKTHLSTTGKSQPGASERIPFVERLTCSVDDASEASGLGRSTLYNMMRDGEIEWVKVGARRLLKVQSLLTRLNSAEPCQALRPPHTPNR
jgi:excisionase family DNA binding protein